VRWNRAAALALLAVAGVAGWWPVLGSGLLWAAPVAVAAALVTARAVSARLGVALLVAWLPVAPLLAGVPPSAFRHLSTTGGALTDGLSAIGTAAGSRILDDPYALAAALLAAGLTWMVAAILTTRGPAPTLTALLILVYPMLAAVLLESTPPNAAWHGGVLLAAAMLWFTRGRLAVALPAAALISLVAVGGAQAFGPHERWVTFDKALRKPPFTRLDPTQSYGPLYTRQTGATMLEVTSPRPALWRMQVLESFDGRGWRSSHDEAELPQPAAQTVTTTVRYVGLGNRLIAAPGRITSVSGGESTGESSRGEAWRFTEPPSRDATYTITSSVVQATAEQLADVQIPADGDYDRLTTFWPRRLAPRSLARAADRLPNWLEHSQWGHAIQLARRLAQGTTSELEVVRRVENYLTSGRFRYTTEVAEPGDDPLLDFLFKTREGYCQHFAGAATLLLRLAGVPTRVVTGFATGKRTGEHAYTVRDQDAHAWIEVYFPGFGWVPFNPTPAAAEADVAPEADVLLAPGASGGVHTGSSAFAFGGLGVLLAGGAFWYRRRRRNPAALAELLTKLAPEPVTPSTTLSALKPRLATLGPSIAALADQAERARFAADGTAEPPHPRLRVWRALARDRGAVRATLALLRGLTASR
jgi:LPXTG-motif cell wall-anchored protein